MHYKNGREAKNGDPVIAKNYAGKIVAGVIHNLIEQPGATCNCDVVTVIPGGTQNLTPANGQLNRSIGGAARSPSAGLDMAVAGAGIARVRSDLLSWRSKAWTRTAVSPATNTTRHL